MKKLLIVGLGVWQMCFTAQADAAKYWFVSAAGNSNISGENCLLEDATQDPVAFVDGNWLCSAAPYANPQKSWVPDHVNNAIKTYSYGGAINFDRATSVYGLFLQTGSRTWNFAALLTVGAGGMEGNTGWSQLVFKPQTSSKSGCICLDGAQTWKHNNALRFSVPITATNEPVWTLNGTSSSYRFVRVDSATALTNADLVVTGYSLLGIGTATGSIGARTLTLSGGYAGFILSDYSLDGKGVSIYNAVIDHRFTTNSFITLRDGVDLSAANWFDGAILDPALSFKVSGTGASLGANATYSIKDGGTFVISIDSGATFVLESLPTVGTLKIVGTGTFSIGNVAMLENLAEKCDFTAFEGKQGGTLTFRQQSLTIPSLEAYAGYNFVFKDCAVRIREVGAYTGTITLGSDVKWHSQSFGTVKCSLAMPPTATWPAGLKVVVGTRSHLFLPDTTDEGIADKVTGPYTIGCRGWTKEAAGTHEFTKGDFAYVIGDGFESDSTILLTGGKLFFPVDVTVASTVTNRACSTQDKLYSIVGAGVHATVNFTGYYYGTSNSSGLMISNDCNATEASDSSGASCFDYEVGTVVFSGHGEILSYLKQYSGDLEFRGGTWKMGWGNNPRFDIQQFSCYTRFTGNVNFEMTDGLAADSSNGSREHGIDVSCSAVYGRGIIVEKGSTLTIGAYRDVTMGGGYYGSSALLWAKGGQIRIKGPGGQFSLRAGTSPTDLKNTSADRCGCFILRATEGGVIETERVLTSYPVTHGDSGLENDNYRNQQTARPGLHVELDGGTLRYGANFGVAADGHTGLCRPFLFGQGLTLYSNKTYAPDYDHTADIRFYVGTAGGALDLSPVTAYTTISNTIPDTFIATTNLTVFPAGVYPNLGPRWDVRGCFAVKGNGAQTFVIHDANDNAAFTNVVVDGITMKVVSDTAKTYKDLTIGAKPGAVVVESKDGQSDTAVSFTSAQVAADGAFLASLFNGAVTIDALIFGENATLYSCTRETDLPALGSVTLPGALAYLAQANDGTVALRATSVSGAPTWTRAAGSVRRVPKVSSTGIDLLPRGITIILR